MEETKKNYIMLLRIVLVGSLSALLFYVFDGNDTGLENTPSLVAVQRVFNMPNFTRFTLGAIVSVWRFIAYSCIGLAGAYFSSKIGFIHIVNSEIKKRKNILITIAAGIVMGAYFIVYDRLLPEIFNGGYLLDPTGSRIPSSIFASVTQSIVHQITNMFLISLPFMLWSKIIKLDASDKELQAVLFWIFAVLSAALFTMQQIRTTIYFSAMWNPSIFRVPMKYMLTMVGLFAPLSLVCAYFLKKFGLLSAILVHLICDLSWRVIWAYTQIGERMFWN
jgi:hypothetical protein